MVTSIVCSVVLLMPPGIGIAAPATISSRGPIKQLMAENPKVSASSASR
jgi:hypothetical protein